MKILKGFAILFICLLLGSICKMLINFPIPEVVYGMLFLLIFLMAGIVKVDMIEDVSNGLLSNLAFLFVPVSVSLVNQIDVLGSNIIPIVVIVLASGFITMGVTAKVVELVQKWRNK
ncbi:CidA/LrgA family protein [Peptoniphilaceae bacterium SGI.131]